MVSSSTGLGSPSGNNLNNDKGIRHKASHLPLIHKGLPHAIHVTTANVTDRDGAIEMMSSAKRKLR